MEGINTEKLSGQLAQFKDIARGELRQGFQALRELYPGHRFYVLGLYTTPLYAYIAPVGNSEETLFDEESRWNPGDWECRLPGLDQMEASNKALNEVHALIPQNDQLQFIQGVMKDCFFSLLKELQKEGVFVAFGREADLLLNVVTPDDSTASWLADAKRLNDRTVWERMEHNFRQFGCL